MTEVLLLNKNNVILRMARLNDSRLPLVKLEMEEGGGAN